MEITVIDDSDHVGWLAAATREGEIYMADVESMVNNVLTELARRQPYRRVCTPNTPLTRIDRLNILDHGNDNGIQIGSDWINLSTLPGHLRTIQPLQGKFAQGGFVHFQHCNVGSNRKLMLALAQAFGVTVFAGTGAHNPVYRFNFGSYVRATPGGTYTSGVERP